MNVDAMVGSWCFLADVTWQEVLHSMRRASVEDVLLVGAFSGDSQG